MDNLSDDIIKYKKGELNPQEMHALEKKALDDPFLAEALEGSDSISANEFAKDIAELNSKIIATRKIIFTPLRIAAGLVLISASVFLVYQVAPKQETLALKTEKSQLLNQKNAKADVKKHSEPQQEKIVEPKKEIALSKPNRNPKKTEEIKQAAESAVQNDFAANDKIEEVNPKPEVTEEKKAEVASAPIVQQPLQDVASVEKTDKKRDAHPYSYSVQGARAKQTASQTIIGTVVSSEDNSALPGVNVIIKGTTVGTVTDASGSFTISSSENDLVLNFSFIGFQSKDINVQGQNSLVVKLENDVTQLSEVVVTGVSPFNNDDSEPVVILADPVGGKKAYDKYLEANVHYPEAAQKNNIKGKVRVEFAVHSDGSFDEYKVVKSIGYGCDEELIRLIKEGPKWSPTTKNSQPVESKVRVGLRFDTAKQGR